MSEFDELRDTDHNVKSSKATACYIITLILAVYSRCSNDGLLSS